MYIKIGIRILDAEKARLSPVCAILFLAVAALSSEARAQAQFDPNIQSRLDTVTQKLSPTLDFSASAGEELASKIREICLDLRTLGAGNKLQNCDAIILSPDLRATLDKLAEIHRGLTPNDRLRVQLSDAEYTEIQNRIKRNLYEVNFRGPQPLTVSVQSSLKPAYETNAGRTAVNPQPDHYLNYGGTVQITNGVGKERPYDVWGASVQSTSSRYGILTSKSNDALVLQAAYQFFLDGFYFGPGGALPVYPNALPDANVKEHAGRITYDVLLLGVSNQAAYTPVFKMQAADLLTPQVQLSRQNIALFGHDGLNLCHPDPSIVDLGKSMKDNPPKPDEQPDKLVFCNYANVTINSGYTASPTDKLQNGNIAATLTLGHRFDRTNWSLEWESSITEKVFTDTPGGRRDVTVATGPSLKYKFDIAKGEHSWYERIWSDGISGSLSLPVTYNENMSSITKDDWKSWIVLPTLTLTFKASQKPLDKSAY